MPGVQPFRRRRSDPEASLLVDVAGPNGRKRVSAPAELRVGARVEGQVSDQFRSNRASRFFWQFSFLKSNFKFEFLVIMFKH